MSDTVLNKYAGKYTKDNTAKLKKLIKELTPAIKQTDVLQKELTEQATTLTPERAQAIGKQLVGYNHFFNKTAEKLHALRHNKRVAFRYLRAREYSEGNVTDANGKEVKGTDKALDSDADLYISEEREVYRIINSYAQSCRVAISYIQSLLKNFEGERNENI